MKLNYNYEDYCKRMQKRGVPALSEAEYAQVMTPKSQRDSIEKIFGPCEDVPLGSGERLRIWLTRPVKDNPDLPKDRLPDTINAWFDARENIGTPIPAKKLDSLYKLYTAIYAARYGCYPVFWQ